MSRQAPPNGIGFNVFPVAGVPCIDCKSTDTQGPDHEGFRDCLSCGAAWIPGVATPDADPESLPCDACGAEPLEPCRVGCLGYFVAHGDV